MLYGSQWSQLLSKEDHLQWKSHNQNWLINLSINDVCLQYPIGQFPLKSQSGWKHSHLISFETFFIDSKSLNIIASSNLALMRGDKKSSNEVHWSVRKDRMGNIYKVS